MPSEWAPGKPHKRPYSDEKKVAAVRMVRTLRAELETEHGTVHRFATLLGYGIESVRSGSSRPRRRRPCTAEFENSIHASQQGAKAHAESNDQRSIRSRAIQFNEFERHGVGARSTSENSSTRPHLRAGSSPHLFTDLAELEREVIYERVVAELEVDQARGVELGQPIVRTPEHEFAAKTLYWNGQRATAISNSLGIGNSTADG